MSRWHEPIDRQPGRCPVIQATGQDLTYTLAILGGEMTDGFLVIPQTFRMVIRCTDEDEIFVRWTRVPS